LNQVRGLASLTAQGTQRLLGLEVAPFAGGENAGGEGRLKLQLKNWLVQNEIRNEQGVDAAVRRVVERRNAEARGEEVESSKL
jgi:hypothetical protein